VIRALQPGVENSRLRFWTHPGMLVIMAFWLSRVLPLVKPRGRIILVLFPDLVRPTAREELGWLTQRLASLGTVEQMPRHAIYTTPRFEAEVLGRLGVPDLREWRTAQILRVSLGDQRSVSPTASVARIRNRHAWQRFACGRQIIALRADPTDTGPVEYRSAGGSFELRSTSRRDRQSAVINLWTSRNRGAVVCGTAKIVAFLARMEAGLPPQAACAALGASHEDAAALIRLTESLQFVAP
jgi:hypothetical protein